MFLFEWLGWFVLSITAGWLASVASGTNERHSFFLDLGIGLAGAFVGGWMLSLLPLVQVQATGLNPRSLLIALLGAYLLRQILKAITQRFSS